MTPILPSPFAVEALKAKAAEVLGSVPPDRHGALLMHVALDGTLSVSVAERLGDDWRIGAWAEHAAAEGLSAGVSVIHTW